MVASDDLNAIDRAGPPALPRNDGRGPRAPSQNVQLVDAEEFNDIEDSKAYDFGLAPSRGLPPSPRPLRSRRGGETDAGLHPRGTSWLPWFWSVVVGTFAALAAAVHQQIG